MNLKDGAEEVARLMRSDSLAYRTVYNYARGQCPRFFCGYEDADVGKRIDRVMELMLCDLTAFKAVYNFSRALRPWFFRRC